MHKFYESNEREEEMALVAFGLASGLLAILAGILVIVFPGFLRWTIGLYLVLIGLLSFL